MKRFDDKSEKIPNRQRTLTNESNDSLASFVTLNVSEFVCQSYSPLQTLDPTNANDLLFFEEDFESLMEGCCLSDDDINSDIMNFEKYLSDVENVEERSKERQSANSCSLSVIVRPIATFDKEFNDIELNRLTELKTAANEILDFSGTSKYCIRINSVREMFSKMSSFNLFDQTIESIIKFCKSISMFQEVCQDDQIALIKNSYGDILNLKFLPHYDFDEECFEYVLVSLLADIAKLNFFEGEYLDP